MELFAVAGVIFVAVAILMVNLKAKAFAEAGRKYKASLAALSKSPADSRLRQEALRLGREYSNMTRDRSGRTLFDEVALMNDINAACGGVMSLTKASPQQPASRMSSAPSNQSIEARLGKLASLHAQGLIDDSELRQRRERILDEI